MRAVRTRNGSPDYLDVKSWSIDEPQAARRAQHISLIKTARHHPAGLMRTVMIVAEAACA
jgi:hypothetical protein